MLKPQIRHCENAKHSWQSPSFYYSEIVANSASSRNDGVLHFLSLFLLILLIPTFAFAAPYEPKDKYITNKCSVTPSIAENNYPSRRAIITSNKLVLPAGKSLYADGQLVSLAGRVLDVNCVPVSDAIVEIWQVDPKGHYVKSTLGERMSPYPHFTGSGRAITDNLGRFNFTTLFPGVYGKRAPHINFRIISKDVGNLDTQMFFAGDLRNSDDTEFTKIKYENQQLLLAKVWKRKNKEDGIAAQWDITLDGKNKFRHY